MLQKCNILNDKYYSTLYGKIRPRSIVSLAVFRRFGIMTPMKKIIFVSVVMLSALGANFVLAQTPLTIDFFYSETCPHCAKEKVFLADLQEKYPDLVVNRYEVINNKENQKLLQDFYQQYGVPVQEMGLVPATFTAKKYFIGFNDQIGKDIEDCLKQCLNQGNNSGGQKMKVPVLGEFDPSKISLFALAAVLGTLDGFNPCAMWVLLILISLLLATKSRKQILLVGGTFILAEGLLYLLFMSAWLNVFLAIGYVSLTKIFIGIFGIIFGIWRIKEFLTWQPGVCKVTEGTGSKDKIFDRVKNVVKPAAVPATVLGVILLAFGVNMIEFFCSAGFPVIFTRVLALQDLGTLQYYFYLVLYDLFYMLDDFIVFGFALFTLNRFGFSDKYNRYSTLFAGLLILILGLILIFKPELIMFG